MTERAEVAVLGAGFGGLAVAHRLAAGRHRRRRHPRAQRRRRAARGGPTPTPARRATCRRTSTASRSPPTRAGRAPTPASPRSSPTSRTATTASTSAARCAPAPRSRRATWSDDDGALAPPRPRRRRATRRGSWCRPSACSTPRRSRRCPGLDDFAGHRRSTRLGGTTATTSPAAGSRSIGTGASAIQVVPAIAERTAHLDVYQRTAPWILPRKDEPYTRRAAAAVRRAIPTTAAGHRQQLHDLFERTTAFVAGDPSAEAIAGDRPRLPRAQGRRPRTCGPGSPPATRSAAQRTLVSSDYYPARPARRRRPGHRRRIDARHGRPAIRTADGVERPVDTIVLCTGFRAADYLRGIEVVGRGGVEIHERWARRAPRLPRHRRARLPELLHALRAQHQPGRQLDPPDPRGPGPVRGRRPRGHAGRGRRPTVEVDRATRWTRYAGELERDLATTVWTDGCASYFHNAAGDIVTQLPAHVRLVPRRPPRTIDRDDFSLRRCHVHDLVIRGGTVVDGTGAPARTADVAITGGTITEVGRVDGPAAPRGRRRRPARHPRLRRHPHPLRRPGDLGRRPHPVVLARRHHRGAGQLRRRLRPGPARRPRPALIELMEGVEDIPGTALSEGIRWAWETFPEYLDALDRPPRSPSTSAPTCPTPPSRAYVMGERALDDATADDLAAMCAIVRAGLEAGALGFSTGRTAGHRDVHGDPVPGTFAPEDELAALLGGHGRRRRAACSRSCPPGVGGEITGDAAGAMEHELEWMRPPGRGEPPARSRSSSWSRPRSTTGARGSTRAREANARGANLRPQVGNRCFGVLMGHQSKLNPFQYRPTYRDHLAHLPLAERVGAHARPRGAGADPGRGARVQRPVPHGPDRPARPRRRVPARRLARLRAHAPTRASAPSPGATASTRGRSPTTPARGRRPRVPALAAAELRRPQLRRAARHDAGPHHRAGARRRRRPRRPGLRRQHDHLHAHPLGARPHPGPEARRSSTRCAASPAIPPSSTASATAASRGRQAGRPQRDRPRRAAARSGPSSATTCPAAPVASSSAPRATWPPSWRGQTIDDGERTDELPGRLVRGAR